MQRQAESELLQCLGKEVDIIMKSTWMPQRKVREVDLTGPALEHPFILKPLAVFETDSYVVELMHYYSKKNMDQMFAGSSLAFSEVCNHIGFLPSLD